MMLLMGFAVLFLSCVHVHRGFVIKKRRQFICGKAPNQKLTANLQLQIYIKL